MRSSIIMRAENVIVTIFVNDSLKKITVASIITQPYKVKNVIQMKELGFLYDFT